MIIATCYRVASPRRECHDVIPGNFRIRPRGPHAKSARQAHAAPRAHGLFRHRRPAAAAAARRCAPGAVADRQSGGMGHRAADGAPGPPRPDRFRPAPRRAALELARIRHAGRRVAFLRIYSTAAASARRSRSMRAFARTIRGLPRKPAAKLGSSWATPMTRSRSTPKTIKRR